MSAVTCLRSVEAMEKQRGILLPSVIRYTELKERVRSSEQLQDGVMAAYPSLHWTASSELPGLYFIHSGLSLHGAAVGFGHYVLNNIKRDSNPP